MYHTHRDNMEYTIRTKVTMSEHTRKYGPYTHRVHQSDTRHISITCMARECVDEAIRLDGFAVHM